MSLTTATFTPTRTVRGVLVGGGALLGMMSMLAGTAIALGLIRESDAARTSLGPWLALEVVGGAVASAVSGWLCRRVSGSYRASAILAGIVCCIGLLEATTILRFAGSGAVTVPRWLVILAPLVAATGVLLGGWRPASRSSGASAGSSGGARREVWRYLVPAALLAASVAMALLVLPEVAGAAASRVLAAALALDFTVAVPVLVFLLLVQSKRLPLIVVVPVFMAGYALAVATLPPEHNAVLSAVQLLVIPAELGLVALLVARARRAWTTVPGESGDFPSRLRAAARSVIGSRLAADILTTEITLLYYAGRGRDRSGESDEAFTTHRTVGYGGILVGLTIVLLVETAAVHVLLREWSGAAAWILSGLSGYALVWLVGDYRAIVARPHRITADQFAVRLGVRWEVAVPLRDIAEADLLRSPITAPDRETLVVALIDAANVRVTLRQPVEVVGMYGIRRRVSNLWLRVDEPMRLRAALRRHGCRAATDVPALSSLT